MLVKVPPVTSVDEKVRSLGRIRQILVGEDSIAGDLVPFSKERHHGHAVRDPEGNYVLYVFPNPPAGCNFDPESRVLVGRYELTEEDELDLTGSRWWYHPAKTVIASPDGFRLTALRSWTNAFRFVSENLERGIVGLRRPQLGALHAIHAHWSTSKDIATVVMPTGTGKTETMLSALVSTGCERLLVIVPTDALREQISAKFQTLGILKSKRSGILSDDAHCPVVGTLTSKPKSAEDVREFFGPCNVVITSSSLIGLCTADVQSEIAAQCSHLFIDEAHHAEAATWKAFRSRFSSKTVLQFTATPFREDGKKIDGRIIYVYSLRMAQADGYFGTIRFDDVYEFDAAEGDKKIALTAIRALDEDATKKHIVMARVQTKARASEICAVYRSLSQHEVVVVHSGISQRDRDSALSKLMSGSVRIVVCVDMLGEGFDLPELKIAAFHDIRKSLAITLQLAGRFTRTRPDLGDPVFVVNTARVDVREELRKLYTQDPDWNLLLPQLTSSAIDDEVVSQQFLQGFNNTISEVPIKDIRPAASMVVYKTRCEEWTPGKFKSGLRRAGTYSNVFHSINQEERTLVILSTSEQMVRWTDVESISDWTWELNLAVWDQERSLLYLHGSSNSGSYRDLAIALCGADVELVMAPEVYRCFDGLKRLVLNNVGLDEHLGRNVRYTGRMGSDVETQIGTAARRGAIKAVIAGKGFENGDKASIGAAKRGRIWSSLRLRVDTFPAWAKAVGRKLIDDSIDPDDVLRGTLKPVAIDAFPDAVPITVDWPMEMLERPESNVQFFATGFADSSLATVDVEPDLSLDVPPGTLRIFSSEWQCRVQLRLFRQGEAVDFKFTRLDGTRVLISQGQNSVPIEDFLTQEPPTIWFADGASLEGCQYVALPAEAGGAYSRDRLIAWDWSGVDITTESQGDGRTAGTVQHRLIASLQEDGCYEIIFDDDGAGEAADVVAISCRDVQGRNRIDIDLYHCKFSGAEKAGGRVDDLYVVCGQAQRSVRWLMSHESRTALFTHLLEREAIRIAKRRPTRFDRGDSRTLARLRDRSRYEEVSIRVHIVQPGLSSAKASVAQLELLGVTERYLSDTYGVVLNVICSP